MKTIATWLMAAVGVVGCQGDGAWTPQQGERLELGSPDAVPSPPPDPLTVSPGVLIPGELGTVVVTGAPPAGLVHLGGDRSTEPCYGGSMTCLRNPTPMGTEVADATGRAELISRVPTWVSAGTYFMQAAISPPVPTHLSDATAVQVVRAVCADEDSYEQNDTRSAAANIDSEIVGSSLVREGSFQLELCPGDHDWFTFEIRQTGMGLIVESEYIMHTPVRLTVVTPNGTVYPVSDWDYLSLIDARPGWYDVRAVLEEDPGPPGEPYSLDIEIWYTDF